MRPSNRNVCGRLPAAWMGDLVKGTAGGDLLPRRLSGIVSNVHDKGLAEERCGVFGGRDDSSRWGGRGRCGGQGGSPSGGHDCYWGVIVAQNPLVGVPLPAAEVTVFGQLQSWRSTFYSDVETAE